MAQDTEMRLVNGLPRSYTTADNVENFTNDASAVAVGDAVYISAAGKVSKASNATAAQECTGLVFEVTDTTNCRVITRGILEGVLSGATPNTRYYLGATAGTLVTAKPSGTEVIQVVGLAYNTDDLMVVPQVGITVNPVGATTFDDVYNNSGASPTVTVDNGPLILTGAGTTGSPGPALRMNDDNLIAFGTAGTERLGYDSDIGALTLGPATGTGGVICAGVLLFSELDGSPISVPGEVVDIAYESGTSGSTGLRASHAGNVAVTSLLGKVKGLEVEIEGNTGDNAAVDYTGIDVRTIAKASSTATFTGIEVGADWDYPLHMADDAPIWLGDGYDWSLQHLSSSGGVGALTAAVEESNFRFLNGTWDFYGRTDGATTTCHGTPKDDTGNIALNVRLENATEHGGAALGAGEEIFGVLLTTFGRSGDDATGQYTGFDTGGVSKATSPSDFVAIKVRSTWDTGILVEDDTPVVFGTGSDSSISWIDASSDLRLTAPHLHLAATVEISDTAYDPIPATLGTYPLKVEAEAGAADDNTMAIQGIIFNTNGTTRTGGTFAAFGTNIADKGADSGGEYVGFWAPNPSMTGAGTATAIKVEGAAWDVGLDVDSGAIALDPTGNFTLNMAASQTATITIADNLTSAFKVQQAGNPYLDIKTTNGSELIHLGAMVEVSDFANDPLTLSIGDRSLRAMGEAGTADDNIKVIEGIIFNTNGTQRTGGTFAAFGTNIADEATDTGGEYVGYWASNPSMTGSGTATAIKVEGAAWDVGLDIDNGGAFIADGVTIESAKSGTMGLEMDGLDIGAAANEIGDIFQGSFIRMAQTSTPTAGVANKGFVYTKAASGVAELHYLDSAGVERQLTGTAATTPSLDDIYDNSAGSSYTITTDAGPIILTGGTPAMRFNDSAALEFGTGSDTSLVWDGSSLALAVPDNTVGVFTITEGANSYFYISTDDVSPLMQFGNSATDPSYSFQGSGTVIFNGDMAISERTGDPGAFANYGYVYTKDISTITELFYSDSAGTATQITTNGSIANAHILPDNTVSAFTITEGANEYLNISTDDVSPLMQFGNSATNPGYSFQGSGTVIFNGDTAIQKRVGDPGAFSNYGYVYTKDVSGTVELFYSDDGGTPTQLTGGGGGSGSLDAAYNAGRTITVDAGPIVCNTATTNGGTLDINPSLLTETAYQVDVTWPAGAYTGTLGGLNIDYSGTTTLTNAADVYGINLTGKANSDVVGDSVGLNVGAGWDWGIRVADDVLLSFGNDDDANLLWVSAGFPGLYIQSGVTGARTSIGLLGYTSIRDAANLLDLSSALSSAAFSTNAQAGHPTDTIFGIYSALNNSVGTQRTGGSAACIAAAPEGKDDDTGGDYYAFEARAAEDNGGAGTFYGLTIAGGYDVGIEVSSGGINLHDDVQVSFGNGSDTTLEFLTATDDFVIDHTNASGDVIVRLGSDSTGPTFQVQQDDETALFTVQPFTGANGLAIFGVQTGWSGPLGSGGMGGQILNLNATSNSATSSTQTIDLTVNNAAGTALTSGSMRGIDILMSGHGSDGASSDYYGLTMAASDGGGSATYTGILMNSGWDVGISLWDNIPLVFGTSDDAEIEWNTTYSALRIASGASTSRDPILVDGHINIRDDAGYLRLGSTNSSALTCFVQADHGSANLAGLAGLVDNTSGSTRTGGAFAAVYGSVEGKNNALDVGDYIAFQAAPAVDNGGNGVFYGLRVGTGYDVGVDVQSGAIQLHEQSAPSTPTNAGKVYVKDVSGTSELFFMRDDGTEVQLS